MVFTRDKRSNGERGQRSSQSLININSEDTIFFSCSAKRLDQTTIELEEAFTRQAADLLIREHLKKGKVNVQIYCLNNRILFEKSRSMVIKSIRKYVLYGDITNFYIFSSKPGVFMLCINDSHKRRKTYESFLCEEYKDVDKLSKLISRAQLNPDCRLRRSWDIDGHYVSANGSTQEQIIEVNGQNGLNKENSTERNIIITESKHNGYSLKASNTKFNPTSDRNSREIILKPNIHVSHGDNYVNQSQPKEQDLVIPVNVPKAAKYEYEQNRLNNLFNNNLTFLSTLPSGNIEVSDRGPVFLFSTRMSDKLETYKGPTRLSDYNEATNM